MLLKMLGMRKPGLTSTGRIVEIRGWYFWDDAQYPALIDYKIFHDLAEVILSKDDFLDLGMKEMMATTGLEKQRHTALKSYYSKVADHLDNLKRQDDAKVVPLLLCGWNSELADRCDTGLHTYDHKGWYSAQEMLLTYLDVLKSWNYPVEYEQALNVSEKTEYIIVKCKSAFGRERRYCVSQDEIISIDGFANNFQCSFASATLQFDVHKGLFVRTH